jgi:hypothetical protein
MRYFRAGALMRGEIGTICTRTNNLGTLFHQFKSTRSRPISSYGWALVVNLRGTVHSEACL